MQYTIGVYIQFIAFGVNLVALVSEYCLCFRVVVIGQFF